MKIVLGEAADIPPPLPHPRQGLSQQRRACRLLSPTNPAHKNISFDSFFEQCSAAIRHRGRNGGIQSASINTLCPRILAIKGLFPRRRVSGGVGQEVNYVSTGVMMQFGSSPTLTLQNSSRNLDKTSGFNFSLCCFPSPQNIRDILLVGHRQAVAWLDEWHGESQTHADT